MKYTAFKLAIEKEIPFVAYGWTPGQAPVSSSILKINPQMLRSMEQAIREPLIRAGGEEMAGYFLREKHYADPEKFPTLVHPAAFLGYSEKKALAQIRKLGWKKPKGLDANSTNCLLNSLNVVTHEEKYGFNPYVFEVAKLVREGYLSRVEGLKKMSAPVNAKTVAMVKRRLK